MESDLKDIRVECRQLEVREFQELRQSTGWSVIEDAVVQKALENDLFSVCVYDGSLCIGMGRVVGDGAIYFYVQDIIVIPAYKGRGIGALIMKHIEAFIDETAAHNAFIGLMAAEEVAHFYTKFGYRPRPVNGPGMYKVIQKPK